MYVQKRLNWRTEGAGLTHDTSFLQRINDDCLPNVKVATIHKVRSEWETTLQLVEIRINLGKLPHSALANVYC